MDGRGRLKAVRAKRVHAADEVQSWAHARWRD